MIENILFPVAILWVSFCFLCFGAFKQKTPSLNDNKIIGTTSFNGESSPHHNRATRRAIRLPYKKYA